MEAPQDVTEIEITNNADMKWRGCLTWAGFPFAKALLPLRDVSTRDVVSMFRKPVTRFSHTRPGGPFLLTSQTGSFGEAAQINKHRRAVAIKLFPVDFPPVCLYPRCPGRGAASFGRCTGERMRQMLDDHSGQGWPLPWL